MIYVRHCPRCENKIEYKYKNNFLKASKKDSICSKCTSKWALSCIKHKPQSDKVPKLDLSGRIFNNWQVLGVSHREDHKSNHGIWYWNVKCTNCGLLVKRSTSYVKKSNGCICCKMLPRGETGLNKLLCSYRYNAKKRGLIFALEKDQFRELTSFPCYYCGCLPKITKIRKYKINSGWGDYDFNGIDRIDNKKGYLIANCVPCCRTCNRGKGGWSFQFWVSYLQQLFRNALDGKIRCLDVVIRDEEILDAKYIKRW